MRLLAEERQQGTINLLYSSHDDEELAQGEIFPGLVLPIFG